MDTGDEQVCKCINFHASTHPNLSSNLDPTGSFVYHFLLYFIFPFNLIFLCPLNMHKADNIIVLNQFTMAHDIPIQKILYHVPLQRIQGRNSKKKNHDVMNDI